jgi:hypothetical protein
MRELVSTTRGQLGKDVARTAGTLVDEKKPAASGGYTPPSGSRVSGGESDVDGAQTGAVDDDRVVSTGVGGQCASSGVGRKCASADEGGEGRSECVDFGVDASDMGGDGPSAP